MFKNRIEQSAYIIANYPEVTDARIDEDHWDLHCPHCKVTRGFQVARRDKQTYETRYTSGRVDTLTDLLSPTSYFFFCPVCKAYKQWLIFIVSAFEKTTEGKKIERNHYFRISSIPGEGMEEIDELPENPSSLREAYRQAIRASDANAHMAAGAMFRRAVQIITREILGATPSTLHRELHEVVGKTHNGHVVTDDFASVGYIVKEAGNQAAHPDSDPDLLSFTAQDAQDLQRIFLELVSDLFVTPAAVKKSRADFLARRKIHETNNPKS